MRFAATISLLMALMGCTGELVGQSSPVGGVPIDNDSTTFAGHGEEQFVTLKHIPHPASVRDIQVQKGLSLNVTHANQLSPDELLGVLRSAEPIDTPPKDWAYVPWYSGTFNTPEGIYHFQLYLGGLGKLVAPDGKHGMFSYRREATQPTQIE